MAISLKKNLFMQILLEIKVIGSNLFCPAKLLNNLEIYSVKDLFNVGGDMFP